MSIAEVERLMQEQGERLRAEGRRAIPPLAKCPVCGHVFPAPNTGTDYAECRECGMRWCTCCHPEYWLTVTVEEGEMQ